MKSEHYLTEDGIKIPSIPEPPGNLVLNAKSGGNRRFKNNIRGGAGIITGNPMTNTSIQPAENLPTNIINSSIINPTPAYNVEELVINEDVSSGVATLTSDSGSTASIASNSTGDLYVGRDNTIFKITNGASRVIANGRAVLSGEKPPLPPFTNICNPQNGRPDYNPNNNRNYEYTEENVNALTSFNSYVGDIVFDNLGNIYIIDTQSRKIRKIDIRTNKISTYAGNGYYGDSPMEPPVFISGDGGPAIHAFLGLSVLSIAFDNNNNLYILCGSHVSTVIRVVDARTGIIRTVAGVCNIDARQGNLNDNQIATSVSLSIQGSTGMVIDNNGNIYFSDNTFGSVRKIDATTKMITNYAGPEATTEVFMNGRPETESTGDGGLATAATFGVLGKLSMDNNGNLFICDGNRLRKVTRDGIINTIIGGPEPVLGALLGSKFDLTVMPNGIIYVLDMENRRVLKVTSPVSGGRRRKSRKTRKVKKSRKARKARKSRK